jgi:hypothetical protein
MANEITITTGLVATSGSFLVQHSTLTKQATLTTATRSLNTQSIATSATALVIAGGVAAAGGWAWFRNLDATNYVSIGVYVSTTFYPLVRLNAGEAAVFRLGVITPYAVANTLAVILEHDIMSA